MQPTVSQGGAASPLTLGFVVQPLRGIRIVSISRVWPNLELRSLLLALLLLLVLPQALAADEPLHWRIDELVAEGNADFVSRAAPRADDAEFIRRIYLDFVGTIPTADEVSSFLSDPDFDKRTRLIDRLLDDPRHVRRLQYVFDVMLMERRPDKNVTSKEWREYLRQSFLENKPLDQLVREILSADGSDPKLRPAAKFVLDRNLDADLVTRDIGRIFLGRDMQCAQCHDHPSVDDYLQRHYFGITAFFKRSYLFTDPKTKKVSIGEKAEGEVTFVSVFTDVKGETGPRMLDLPGIADPPPAKKPYVVKPAKNARRTGLQPAAQTGNCDDRSIQRRLPAQYGQSNLGVDDGPRSRRTARHVAW